MNLNNLPGAATSAYALCFIIEQQRARLDARLRYPAAWRGSIMPREESGELTPRANTEKYAAAFNFLRDAYRQNRALDSSLLLDVAARLAELHEFRRDATDNNAKPRQIRAFNDRALDRARDGKEPPPLAAARLHLELQIIRPFIRSNGRLARLMASYVLIKAGYRSTLFTAVEQHFLAYPEAYAKNFAGLANSGGDAWPWLTRALEAMALRSCRAAWFYQREEDLRARGLKLGLTGRALERALIDFDALDKPKGPLAATTQGQEIPLSLWRERKGKVLYSELMSQLMRLRAEETDDAVGK